MLVAASFQCAPAAGSVRFAAFGWESGGLGPAALGDTLWIAGLVDRVFADSGIPYWPGSREYTVLLRDLISWGEQEADIYDFCLYSGGRLEIYAGLEHDADYLATNAGAEPPAAFGNGDLWLSAAIVDFRFIRGDYGRSFYCRLEFDGGLALPWFRRPGDCAAGCDAAAGDYLAAGYTLAFDEAWIWTHSGTDMPDSFSAIKSLY